MKQTVEYKIALVMKSLMSDQNKVGEDKHCLDDGAIWLEFNRRYPHITENEFDVAYLELSKKIGAKTIDN